MHQVLSRRAAISNEPVVFLLSDASLAAHGGSESERLLVLVDSLLATGLVPNLFGTDEEMNCVLEELKPSAHLEGVPVESRSALLEFFVEKVRANLHLVLCFSPTSNGGGGGGGGSVLRRRCRRFPALVTCTTVDWFNASWPKDALVGVAHHFLNKLPMLKEGKQHDSHNEDEAKHLMEAKAAAEPPGAQPGAAAAVAPASSANQSGSGRNNSKSNTPPGPQVQEGKEDGEEGGGGESKLAENLAHHMATTHQGVEEASAGVARQGQCLHAHVTPTCFLELIEVFGNLLRRRTLEVNHDIGRLEHGVEVLKKTAEDVEVLKDELEFKLIEVVKVCWILVCLPLGSCCDVIDVVECSLHHYCFGIIDV